MPKVFNYRLSFEANRNVRDYSNLLSLLKEHHPNGKLWPLVAPRRSGKTWTLEFLKAELLKETADGAAPKIRLLTLADTEDRDAFWKDDLPDFVLIDEPSSLLFSRNKSSPTHIEKFLKRCAELRKKDRRLLVAMSPREWELLLDQNQGKKQNFVDQKDLQYLKPLSLEEAEKLVTNAGRNHDATWAKPLLAAIPALWKRNPCLLELLFEVAEEHQVLRLGPDTPDPKAWPEWEDYALTECREPPTYLEGVYSDGLSDRQKDIVRKVAWEQWESSAGDNTLSLLVSCGLIVRQRSKKKGANADLFQLADPVLANHLPPPLRIHHVSDLHFGDLSAEIADVKTQGSTGRALRSGVQAPVRDDYLDHVTKLATEKPHLIVVSGDIAERGDEKLYAEAKQWLEKLRTKLAESHPKLKTDIARRILLVGGNHDVDWGNVLGDAGSRERHLPFAKAFDGFPRTMLEKSPMERTLSQEEFPEANLVFCLLGSAEFGGEKEDDPAWGKIIEVINSLREKAVDEINKKDWKACGELLEHIARIDPGLVHHEDINRLREFKKDKRVKIAVVHHPVSPMPFTEVARFAGMINAGDLKAKLFYSKFSLVLHGHMHAGWFASESWPGEHDDWVLHIASAPTLGSKHPQGHHGYNEITVTYEGDECELTVKRVLFKDANWNNDKGQLGPFKPGRSPSNGSR